MSDSPNPIVRITVSELRERFNNGLYYEKVLSGELTQVVQASHLAPDAAGQPPGTLSQQVSYYDSAGNEIARVHQYVKPDGNLGASGKPDPKRLFESGIWYRLEKQRETSLATTATEEKPPRFPLR